MKKLLLAAALVGVSAQAMAANWMEYNTKSNNATFYYDKDSVKIKKFANGGKYIQVWERSEFDSDQYGSRYVSNCGLYSSSLCNKPYQSLKSLNYYDCYADRITSDREYQYTKSGNLVDSVQSTVNTKSSLGWNDVIPDTVGEGKLKEICRAYRSRLK